MRKLLFLLAGLSLTACGAKYKTEVGLTAKTYDKKFTKNTAQHYAYRFNTDNISYIDRDGIKVDLTDIQRQQIADNIDQCLNEAGYAGIITNSSNKTRLNMTNPLKTVVLNLKFTESTTDDEELFYGQAMADKFPKYDYERYEEKGIGPQSRSVIPYGLTYSTDTFLQDRHAFSRETYSETLFNYVSPEKIYYVTYPHYSQYAGLERSNTKIDTNCKRRYSPKYNTLISREIDAFSCHTGTANLSNFYATLSGNIGTNKQFETTLHYKTNFIKRDSDLEKTRDYIVDFLSKNICLFIADNAEDLGMKFVNTEKESGPEFALEFEKHQIIKNKSNEAIGNYYTIKNKLTGDTFTNSKRNGVISSNLYSNDEIAMNTGCQVANSTSSGLSAKTKSHCYQDLYLRKMIPNIDDIDVKNNLKKEDE